MILERNARIICRRLEDKWLLYDPDRRDTMTLNPAGAELYTALADFTDAGVLLQQFAGDNAAKRHEAENFLGMLQKYGYIAGFTGEIPERKADAGDVSGQYGIGFSMAGTFFSGDRLETIPVNTADLSRGDVIRFTDGADKMIAHRIIGGTPGAWITMGDNNAVCDPEPVTGKNLQLVTAVWRNGIRHEIARGKAGMRHFGRLRRKRFFKLALRKLLGIPARLLIKCCFWRKVPAQATDFGRSIQYSDGGRIIGWQIRKHPVYASHRLKFFYCLPEGE